MGDRAVDCARLESVCAERHRGFESPPIRPASRPRFAGSETRLAKAEPSEARAKEGSTLNYPGFFQSLLCLTISLVRLLNKGFYDG
jgi:hypothetical protein